MRNNIVNTNALIISLLTLGAGLIIMMGSAAFAYLVVMAISQTGL